MKDKLFNTDEKKADAMSAFTSLLAHPGWKLIEAIQDENIEILKEQLENGLGDDETKEDIDRLRDKLSLVKEFRNLPANLIDKLQSPESSVPNPDPFDTIQTIKARRENT
jgi:hypothetical protein